MRIGFTLLLNQNDSRLSPHFGKAKWIGIYDTETESMRFERNTGLNGRFVADVLGDADCTHAVLTSIGPGALEHLHRYGIAALQGDADTPWPLLAKKVQSDALPPAEASDHERHHLH